MSYYDDLQDVLDQFAAERGLKRRKISEAEARTMHEAVCRLVGTIDGQPYTADEIVAKWNELSHQDEW